MKKIQHPLILLILFLFACNIFEPRVVEDPVGIFSCEAKTKDNLLSQFKDLIQISRTVEDIQNSLECLEGDQTFTFELAEDVLDTLGNGSELLLETFAITLASFQDRYKERLVVMDQILLSLDTLIEVEYSFTLDDSLNGGGQFLIRLSQDGTDWKLNHIEDKFTNKATLSNYLFKL
jgi:hypothetical protein